MDSDDDINEGVSSESEETDGEEQVEVEDDQVEDAPVSSRKRKSRGKTSVSPKRSRKNNVIPRHFEFSVTIVVKGEDIDADRVKSLLDDFIKKHTERTIVCF